MPATTATDGTFGYVYEFKIDVVLMGTRQDSSRIKKMLVNHLC